MKKKLFLRLCLILMVAVTAYSCRTDQFPEHETYNSSAKFQLTSKRISLDEAKHKAQLIPEINKAKAKFREISKTNVNGKIIDYGNGVSIDTDDVIFIENGPDYHTYTFHLKKENDLPSDPVENLVLSPMVDGSYKELLVSYQLTPSEKATLSNGGYVDTTGKTTVTELAAGTYTPLSKGLTSCGWVESYTFMGCSDVHNGVSTHNENNMSDWKDCKADRKPGLYMTMTYRCDFSGMTDDMGNPSNPSGSSGSSGGGSSGTGDPNYDDSGNNTSPCANGGVLDGPQGLTTDPGDGNCSGIPTQPNLPDLRTPCKQLQSLKDKAGFSEKMITLKSNVENGAKEKGFVMHDDNTTPTSSVIEGGSPHDPADVNFEPYYNSIDINLLYKTYGSAHNHLKNNPKHIGVPTPEDFNSLLLYGLIETNPQNPNHISTPKKAIVLVTTKIGLFALKINDLDKMKAYISKYMLMTNEKKEDYVKKNFFNNKKYNILPSSTHDQQVTGFLRFLKDMEVGADMYEGNPVNNGDWKKLNLVENTNGTYSYTQTPCNI